jgi:hypothetical protein
MLEDEKRQCGGCSICCNIGGVATLGKPAYADCEFRYASGCSIHPTRPQECRAFECTWKLGWTATRPDKLGALFLARKETTGTYLDVWLVDNDRSKFAKIRQEAEQVIARRRAEQVSCRLIPAGSRMRMDFQVDRQKYPQYNPVAENRYVGRGGQLVFADWDGPNP